MKKAGGRAGARAGRPVAAAHVPFRGSASELQQRGSQPPAEGRGGRGGDLPVVIHTLPTREVAAEEGV